VYCSICDAPTPDHNEECCGTINGKCEVFVSAGWQEASARIYVDDGTLSFRKLIVSRGAWICPKCADRYGAK
jgi:hypothetical protein